MLSPVVTQKAQLLFEEAFGATVGNFPSPWSAWWVSDVQVITDTAKRCESPQKLHKCQLGALSSAHIFTLLWHRAYSSTDIMAGVIHSFFIISKANM